jgi:hypothetical protein
MDTDAIDRITDVGPWRLVGTNEVVVNNKANLASTPLIPIDHDESGEPAFKEVWTGRSVGGRGGASCGSWTISAFDAETIIGHTAFEDSSWTDHLGPPIDCSTPAGLYCLQQ